MPPASVLHGGGRGGASAPAGCPRETNKHPAAAASGTHLDRLVPAFHGIPRLIPLPDQVLALLVQLPEVLGCAVQLDLSSLQQQHSMGLMYAL
jgi:hypothetical protein